MAKITQDQRQLYQQEIKRYKAKIDEITKKINAEKLELAKHKDQEAQIRFNIANKILNLITLYCSLNELSLELLDVKNNAFLEKARQQLYEAIIQVENVTTKYLDVPFTEYENSTFLKSNLSDLRIVNFIKKLGYCIDLVKEDFGENTKWKWSFIEVEGRFAIIAKNSFNLKKFQKLDDPRQEGYKERVTHFRFIQRLLLEASNGYREKFELITKDVEDLKHAIDFQKSLLRLNQLTGDDQQTEKCKKQIDVWNTILERHLAQIEEEKKRRLSSNK
jgi:hypothetical protein